MKPQVVITGASGFLGNAVVKHCRARDVQVAGFARRAMADINQVDSYEEIPDADVIVHCAEISNAALAEVAGSKYFDEATSLTAALTKKAGRLIYASSAMVYGDAIGRPRKTTEVVTPFNNYTRIKLACEGIVANSQGTSLRLANLYGPGLPEGTVLADILSQLGRPGPVVLRNITAIRDFLWIEDAANAIFAALVRPILPPVLNLGSGEGLSVGELATRVLQAAGEPDRRVEGQLGSKPSALWLDVSQTMDVLDWSPQSTIERGIASILAKG